MTEIEGYTDLTVIGRGGFAVVYRARQVSVGRDVAIKLLTDPSPDDDLVRRFKRESQAVGALSWHPHIAAVVDAGSTAQGQAYIVFELLAGGSLEERIEHAPMQWTVAVSAMVQVADGVEAAHRADVLHRDIKPANILLDRLGVAKLGDFGIASMQDGHKTATGMLATTIAHAAPELFDGQPASPATDVYALGSTLHALVTGAPPFSAREGEGMGSVISRIAAEAPPRLDPAVVPEQVATVIAHALAKQPQYRPRTAAAFGQMLQQAQRELGQKVTAMPVTDNELATPALAPTRPQAPPAASAPATAPPAAPAAPAGASSAAIHHVAPAPSATTVKPTTKPFSRTIVALSVVAVLLAAGVGGLVLYQAQRTPAAVAITAGGARVLSYDALDVTQLAPPFDEVKALDGDDTTYWGVMPAPDGTGIVGTSYVIKLTEAQTVVRVGISNGTSMELGRISGLIWGTSINELDEQGPTVVDQDIPNEPGSHTREYRTTTDQIVLAITGVHDDPARVGIAEILIEVEEPSAG